MSPVGAPGRPAHVLLIDDSPGDVRLTQEAFREASKTSRLHIVKSYRLRANCSLSKPVQLDAFQSLVTSINDFWLTKVNLPQPERVG